MNTAERIGLPGPFGLLAGHSFLVTLLICWATTPGVMYALAVVLEGRFPSLSLRDQFLSFWPGDLFLGAMAAGLLTLAQRLPDEARWYNSLSWHGLVLCATAVAAIFLTYGEWKSGAYPTRAIFSPTKLYHNGVLYGLYGYVIVVTLVAVIFGSSWSEKLAALFVLVLVPGVIWAALVYKDNTLPPQEKQHKFEQSHTATWKPWVR